MRSNAHPASRRISRAIARPARAVLAAAALAAVVSMIAAPTPARADSADPAIDDLGRALRAGAAAIRASGADGVDQIGAWQAVAIPGATCGRGAPFKYYLSPSTRPDAGIFFLLNGGGACLKDGRAPADATGIARSLYCMDFPNFEDTVMSDAVFTGLASAIVGNAIPYFNRSDAANPFRDYHFAAVPYCTGDVFAGGMTAPYDYDPDPSATFEVTHRGHLNFLGVVEDMYRRYPGDVPVVLSGMSAGGFGAIYNFPEVIERWPRTVLIPDSGIAPPQPTSLLAREGQRLADRWGARGRLPAYCATDDCLGDTQRLLVAHAAHFDGRAAPWRPFGYLASQQDATLADYLEISKCGYQLGLRRGLGNPQPANLRAYIPATDKHVFSLVIDPANPLGGARPYTSRRGVNALDWFRKVAVASAEDALPPDAVDPWLSCNATFLPTAWGQAHVPGWILRTSRSSVRPPRR